ncbi:MAG TPA: hypothetical protein VIR63_01420, partial [Pontiella sp.]
MTFESDSSVSRVLKNGIFLFLRLGVHVLAGIVFVPFLFKNYGDGRYGLVALAGFLGQYVGLISAGVGNAVARFLNIALNQNDWRQANEIFSTAIIANLGLMCVQIPLFALGVWKLEYIIDFPPEVAVDFRILVVCNIILFFITMISGVLGTPVQAANRIDIHAKADMVRQVLRVLLLFYLISGVGAHLWIIGVVDLVLAVIYTAVMFPIWRSFARNLVFRWEHVSGKWIKPVLGMAGWMLAFSFGQALFLKTDVWVLNRFLSKEMAGVYAVLLAWPNLMRQIGNQVAALMTPVYMIDFAKGNLERMAESCLFSFKLLSFFAAILGGILCGSGSIVLKLWLGEAYVIYRSLFYILILYVVLTLNKAITWPIFPAVNQVAPLGTTTLFCGLLNIVLSIGFVFLGWGTHGVALATFVSLFILYGILYPMGVSRILSIRFRCFASGHLQTLALFLIVAVGVHFIWQLPIHVAVQI